MNQAAEFEEMEHEIAGTVGTPLLENPKMSTRNVDVFYGDKQAIFDVSLDLAPHEVIALIGPSGCGKSTIMNVLAGLDTPTDGLVFMEGVEVSGPSLDRGVVFQNYSLLPWLSALHNVTFAVRSRWPGWSKDKVREHSYEYLQMVGLGDGALLAAAVFDQIDAQHQTHAAHIADQRMIVLHIAKAFERISAQLGRPLWQVLAFDNVDSCQSGGGGKRIFFMGVMPDAFFGGDIQIGAGNHGGKRYHATTDAFSNR